jgi:sensor histidine kinase YesM
MNYKAEPAGFSKTSKRMRSFASIVFKIACYVCAVTLLVFAIHISLGNMRMSQTGIHIVASFVYTVLIALPSMGILALVTQLYTERFPRLIVLAQIAILLCTSTAGCLAGGIVLQLAGIVPRGGYWIEFWGSFPFATVITLMIGLTTTAHETLRYKYQAATLALRTQQVEQERAYKLLAEARLSSLESRIHPHFLFNTLNSIAALIPSDPQRAEDTVGKLASLLRFSLNANQSGLVPLRIELKIVRDYLEIEKTRFGPRIRYEMAVPEGLQDVKVPPLALQSLVENAVKHVAAQRAQGAFIQIAATKDTNRIRLEVIDDGPGFLLDAITPEHGLGNLIARLELLFGAAGQLEVTRENEKTTVRLSFPV